MPYSYAAETISISLDTPKGVVKKTDIKIKGKVEGLAPGKKYIIQIRVVEDGGPDYSAPFLKSFTVEDDKEA